MKEREKLERMEARSAARTRAGGDFFRICRANGNPLPQVRVPIEARAKYQKRNRKPNRHGLVMSGHRANVFGDVHGDPGELSFEASPFPEAEPESTTRAEGTWMEVEFEKALEVLQRYISPVNARGLLLRALAQQGVPAANLTRDGLRKCSANLRRGVALFVPPSRQEAALQDISDLCGTAYQQLESAILHIVGESDIGKARAEARRICDALGASPFAMQKVATIVSELARNMVLYAGGGIVEISSTNGPSRRVVVTGSDQGPGISNLQEVLSGRYKSRTGLGRGLIGTKRLADRFDVSTGKDGTRVIAEVAV
jgi:serine/threonine-protein kinase RsbT